MTEEHLRSALVRGLIATRPERASRIVAEFEAPWARCPCVTHPSAKPGKRGPSHDVAIADPNDIRSACMLCEVKWIKGRGSAAARIAKDILRLALSRGTGEPSHRPATYLLVGGQYSAFLPTVGELVANKLPLRYDVRGPGGKNARARRPCSCTTRSTGKCPGMLGTSLLHGAMTTTFGPLPTWALNCALPFASAGCELRPPTGS